MAQRIVLPDDRRRDAVNAQIRDFHSDVVDGVRNAVERDAVVVVGMAQNPHVKAARKALEAAGIPFTYLEFGSYLSQWKRRLAIKLWSGYPTFPQVFVRGVLIGGRRETEAALADGSIKAALAEKPKSAASSAN